MIASRPKLRSDLILRAQHTARGTSIVVKDPVSRTFFRLGEAEYFIAQQLDGEASPGVIRQRAEARFGAVLPPETLGAFLQTLEQGGLLESDDGAKRRAYREPSRFRGSALYCRFKVFDPCWILQRLTPWTEVFYTPVFGVLSAAVILAAASITIAYWSDFRHGLPVLFRGWSSIAAVVLVNFLVIGAHEFGHGLTCTRYGGEVHEMGCALVFLQPAFYCNVSDAWLFPEKSQRLMVGIAGPYVELCLWALAVWTWRVTESDTWIHFVGLSVMATSGIKTLLNFNPLIKLDGYYLLSDYLEIPNLRRRSFRFVGRLMETLFGIESPDGEEDLSRRERTVFLLYGTTALAGSFSILAYIILTAGGSLIHGRSPSAVFAAAGFLGMRYRRRLRRMFGKSSGADALDDEDFGTAGVYEATEAPMLEEPEPEPAAKRAQAPADIHHPAPPSGRQSKDRRRRRGRWARRAAWAAVAAGAAVWIVFGQANLRVQGPFTVFPIENADARAAVDGIVDAIYVSEGDRVKKGDVIARLSDKDLLAQLRTTQSQIAQTDATLKKLVTGPTAHEIDVANATVTKAEDALRYAVSRLATMKQAFDQEVLSRKDYVDAEAFEAAARDELALARDQRAMLLSGNRPEDIEAMNEQMNGLRVQRNNLEEGLRFMSVLSPSTGIVATPSLQLKQLHHQLVKKGDLIAKIYDMDTMTVQIEIPEKEIADVEVGQPVVLRARAYPDRNFNGTVTFIATSAQVDGGASGGETLLATNALGAPSNEKRTILVLTQIDNQSRLLKPAMTGQAKILCGSRRILDMITRRFAQTVKVEFWSWW
jgi:putative peptide zinc metalloprotease protein